MLPGTRLETLDRQGWGSGIMQIRHVRQTEIGRGEWQRVSVPNPTGGGRRFRQAQVPASSSPPRKKKQSPPSGRAVRERLVKGDYPVRVRRDQPVATAPWRPRLSNTLSTEPRLSKRQISNGALTAWLIVSSQ